MSYSSIGTEKNNSQQNEDRSSNCSSPTTSFQGSDDFPRSDVATVCSSNSVTGEMDCLEPDEMGNNLSAASTTSASTILQDAMAADTDDSLSLYPTLSNRLQYPSHKQPSGLSQSSSFVFRTTSPITMLMRPPLNRAMLLQRDVVWDPRQQSRAQLNSRLSFAPFTGSTDCEDHHPSNVFETNANVYSLQDNEHLALEGQHHQQEGRLFGRVGLGQSMEENVHDNDDDDDDATILATRFENIYRSSGIRRRDRSRSRSPNEGRIDRDRSNRLGRSDR